MRGVCGRKFDRCGTVCYQQGDRDLDGVRRRWRAHVDRDRRLRKSAYVDRAPSGLGTGRLASPRANRGASLPDRFAFANDRQRVLGVRSLLNHPDRDAGAAGAGRSVTRNPERGAAGRTAWLRSPDVAAAYQSVLRTHARRGAPARCRTGSCGGGGQGTARLLPTNVVDRVIAAGLPAFTRHTITSPDVLRQRLSVIRLTQVATSRNEFECGKAAIAMPIFYGGGRVAAAIELAVRDLSTELKPAAGALSVACHSLSRQLATEFHVTGHRTATGSTGKRVRGKSASLGPTDDPRQNAGRPQPGPGEGLPRAPPSTLTVRDCPRAAPIPRARRE